jgi:hypothetical protein
MSPLGGHLRFLGKKCRKIETKGPLSRSKFP